MIHSSRPSLYLDSALLNEMPHKTSTELRRQSFPGLTALRAARKNGNSWFDNICNPAEVCKSAIPAPSTRCRRAMFVPAQCVPL